MTWGGEERWWGDIRRGKGGEMMGRGYVDVELGRVELEGHRAGALVCRNW